MARGIKRLGARELAAIIKRGERGRYADGGGLYLSISPNGGLRWVLMYTRRGKTVELGLGSARLVTLETARDLAEDARQKIAKGVDLKAERKAERKPVGATFGACADAYVKAHRSEWRSAKHAEQWESTLGDAYCRRLRSMPVAEITTADVEAVLRPIWDKHTETASRLRGRIERVLDAAKTDGHRSEESQNPARWKGHLQNKFSEPSKRARSSRSDGL